jgi:post-segregation antitoxin (ccd killing protein)
MRTPAFDRSAAKKTISLSVNSDLVAKAKAAGLNISAVAEEALVCALTKSVREELAADIRRDMEIYNDFVDRHGSPAQALRDYLSKLDDAV